MGAAFDMEPPQGHRSADPLCLGITMYTTRHNMHDVDVATGRVTYGSDSFGARAVRHLRGCALWRQI